MDQWKLSYLLKVFDDAFNQAIKNTKPGEDFAIIMVEVEENFVKAADRVFPDNRFMNWESIAIYPEQVKDFNNAVGKFFSTPMFKRTKDGMEVIK